MFLHDGAPPYYGLKVSLLCCRNAFIHVLLNHARLCLMWKRKKGGEGQNGEEEIIMEDPVSKFDHLLLEIFMKICP